ncbi:MAG: selenium-dependent molybdenum cofactor biosynthesis protein YqeB [Chloroflexota bacterium]|nr:EF2563 family selenium-dependent molybdenum hydroxylase system protein [Anaerolineae bacterium]
MTRIIEVGTEEPTGLLGTLTVVVKGGGDLATGVAHRLHRVGMRVVVTELARPMVIRRAVSFASAVFEGEIVVDGVRACLVDEVDAVHRLLDQGIIPVIVDPHADIIQHLRPQVVVDAIIAKRNLGTSVDDAPVVIGLGPGFTAGVDVHAVIETMRGHHLGKVIMEGSALPDTGVPGSIEGHTRERVLKSPGEGCFRACASIGDQVEAGDVVAHVAGQPLLARISGVLRGILHDGLNVKVGQKVGDVDPRGIVEHCFTISDKARAIGGGVLEAIMYLWRRSCA